MEKYSGIYGRLMGVLLAGAMLAAMSSSEAFASSTLTFTKDIAPVFHFKCEDSHRPGEIAPMSLLTYEEARPWAKSIAKNVAARDMPPWKVDPNHGSFANDISLSD